MEQLHAGFIWGETGDKVLATALIPLNLPTGGKAIVSLLDRRCAITKTHYDQQKRILGYFYCFAGKCDKVFGLPSVHYVYPMLVYGTIIRGSKIEIDPESDEWRVTFLKVRGKEYDDLIRKDEKYNKGLHTLDLLITCTNDEYQNYDYDIVGNPPALRENTKIKAGLKAAMETYKTNIELAIARKFDTEEDFVLALQNVPIITANKKKEEFPGSRVETPLLRNETDKVTDTTAGADFPENDDGVPEKVEDDIDFDNII